MSNDDTGEIGEMLLNSVFISVAKIRLQRDL